MVKKLVGASKRGPAHLVARYRILYFERSLYLVAVTIYGNLPLSAGTTQSKFDSSFKLGTSMCKEILRLRRECGGNARPESRNIGLQNQRT